jgi:hypothetical protein
VLAKNWAPRAQADSDPFLKKGHSLSQAIAESQPCIHHLN